jgi:transposase
VLHRAFVAANVPVMGCRKCFIRLKASLFIEPRRRSRGHSTARAFASDTPLCSTHCLRQRRFPRLPCNAWHATGHSQQSIPEAGQAFDPIAYRRRNTVERTFCRLTDMRHVATRYAKLTINFAATLLHRRHRNMVIN